MAYIPQEIPVGAIDGVNTTYTTSDNIYQIDFVRADGNVYVGTITYTPGTNTFTLGDAPAASIYVWYSTAAQPAPLPATNLTPLSTYLNLLTQKLAQSNLGFFTQPSRIQAVNEAVLSIADKYEIPQLRKKPLPGGTITFTNGLADIPTDMLRVIKLWDPSIPYNASSEYTYLVNDLFDDVPPQSDNRVWTIDFDPTSGTQKMYIAPSNVSPKALNLRYLRNPYTMVDANDVSGLDYHWDYAVAYKAAAILLKNSRDPSAAIMANDADVETRKAEQALRKPGGVKEGERLRSRFEKYPLLNAPQV